MKDKLVVPLVPLVPLVLFSVLGIPGRAIAHGVAIDYQVTQAVQIDARYDDGEPMANAQVVVYAPDSPAEPWLQGTTDEQGRFMFSPDPAASGSWEVQIRQAGHGEIISIPASSLAAESSATPAEGDAASSAVMASRASGSPNPLQRLVMGGAIIWGFVGTALFFARGKK